MALGSVCATRRKVEALAEIGNNRGDQVCHKDHGLG